MDLRINVKNGTNALKAKCKTIARQRRRLEIMNTRMLGLSWDTVVRDFVEFHCRRPSLRPSLVQDFQV